jgi:sulfite reductase alpha subunit-like flavoprotein
MGKGVDDALRNVLGDAAYQALQEAQRYHRDLY